MTKSGSGCETTLAFCTKWDPRWKPILAAMTLTTFFRVPKRSTSARQTGQTTPSTCLSCPQVPTGRLAHASAWTSVGMWAWGLRFTCCGGMYANSAANSAQLVVVTHKHEPGVSYRCRHAACNSCSSCLEGLNCQLRIKGSTLCLENMHFLSPAAVLGPPADHHHDAGSQQQRYNYIYGFRPPSAALLLLLTVPTAW